MNPSIRFALQAISQETKEKKEKKKKKKPCS